MRSPVLTLLLAAAVGLSSQAVAQTEAALTIGSQAPAIDVAHWFDLRPEGAESEAPAPITDFEAGKVYVVEFWATWCGPCVASIPHISELQESYRDRGVTVMSISSEDVATITPFFDREVANHSGDAEAAPTYRALMNAYRVGSDEDRSVDRDYMEAAGQNGIPCAFLVGKTGQVEWIGHPMQIESVLEAVVSDAWDRDAFAEQFKKEQRVQLVQGELIQAMQSGEFARARELAAEAAELTGQPEIATQIGRAIDQAEFLKLATTDAEAAKTRLDELTTSFEGDAGPMNELAWRVSQLAAAGQPIDPSVLLAVTEAAEAVADPAAPDPSLLDTLAHLRQKLGDLDEAIAHQRGALEALGDEYPEQVRQQVAGFLEELEAEKASSEAPENEE